jgi:Amt family ammonium transporter
MFTLLATVAFLSWAGLGTPLSAQDNAAAPAPSSPPTPTSIEPAPAVAPSPAAPEAAPATAPAPAAAKVAESAPTTPSAPAGLTVEQRVSILEAYLLNGDPTESLKTGPKDKDGNATIPESLANSPTANHSGPGHNAWMMASAGLVLFMTLPGLALFYGGLVRRKNVLSVCAQCLGCAGLVTVLWWAVGYSLVFGKSYGSPFIGGSEFFFFKGVTSAPNSDYSYWVSQNVFACYQLMFAIITPALIVGAIAERMRYSAIMLFITLWMFAVYFPMAHMVWGINGFMSGVINAKAGIHAIDFAGGTVVHMTSGWTALFLCLLVGKRLGFGKEKMAPHNMVLCMAGTGMLWVGWYGFNAGSAVAADSVAANAFTNTTLAAATAGFVWALIELIHKGHASILGFCSGIVAGLVVITPACGFVNPTGAMIIGVLAAAIPYIFVVFLKGIFRYDDALDTFGVHAVGGTLGAILTGVLAVPAKLPDGTVNPDAINPGLAANVDFYINHHSMVLEQFKAVGVTLVVSIVGTLVLGIIVKIILGMRPSREEETQGLDLTDHQEEGYIL